MSIHMSSFLILCCCCISQIFFPVSILQIFASDGGLATEAFYFFPEGQEKGMDQQDLVCPDCFFLPLCMFLPTSSLHPRSLYSSALAVSQLLVELCPGCVPVSCGAGLCTDRCCSEGLALPALKPSSASPGQIYRNTEPGGLFIVTAF